MLSPGSLGQGCQSLLLLLNLKLGHGQMLLRAATFPSFDIGIPRFLHILEKVILEDAAPIPELTDRKKSRKLESKGAH